MFDDVTRTVEAWTCDREAATVRAGPARLRLQVVREEADALVVEVAEGTADPHAPWIYVDDRGVFEVGAALRRQGVGGVRVYLRLRPLGRGSSRSAGRSGTVAARSRNA